jgi:hypothetical protein
VVEEPLQGEIVEEVGKEKREKEGKDLWLTAFWLM